jgi:outer membrane protein assembly factor BamA
MIIEMVNSKGSYSKRMNMMRSVLSGKIKSLFFTVVMFLSFQFMNVSTFGQAGEESEIKPGTDCLQKDLGDLLHKYKPRLKPPRSTMLLIFPNLSYNPANGVLMGIAGSAGLYLGLKEDTRVSSLAFNAAYTTKDQFLFFVKSNIYTNNNKLFLQGDLRYFIYNAYTWGLGTNAPDSIQTNNALVWQGIQTGDIENGYPLDYNYLKIHEVLNWKLSKNHYAGVGYHLDYFYNIKDNALQIEELPYEVTPHYLYSEIYGFSTSKYALSGLSLSYVFDSRDHMINPYEGYYVNVNYRYNFEFLGSSRNSSTLWTEFRTYLPMSDKPSRHLIGFWAFGQFRVSGRQPYMTLMALGEDQRTRSGRGYIAGRYRGENLIYGEVEYRFPISPCTKILGGVLFLNATTASNDSRNIDLFEYVRPGVGFGLRLMMNKNFRTNINIDFAFGKKSKGFYFSGTETF